MGDRLERDVIHARQARRWTRCQAWQLSAIAARQMPLRRRDLFFDQMKIIEKPLARRGDSVLRRYRRSQSFADVNQYAFIGGQARKKLVAERTRRNPMCSGERLAVPFHLIGAEELGSQWRLLDMRLGRQTAGAQTRPELGQVSEDRGGGHQLGRSPSSSGPGGILQGQPTHPVFRGPSSETRSTSAARRAGSSSAA